MSRKYNTLGQLVSVTDELGHVVFDATATKNYDANGNLVSAKDALGTVQKNSFDVLDRLVSSIAGANGTNASTKATTSVFALDALDQLTAVTDPDGLGDLCPGRTQQPDRADESDIRVRRHRPLTPLAMH